jgi:hypothetical protein
MYCRYVNKPFLPVTDLISNFRLQHDKRYLVFDHVPDQREDWLRVSCPSPPAYVMCRSLIRNIFFISGIPWRAGQRLG